MNWEGYSQGANSWELKANILDEALIRSFEEQQAAELDALTEPALRELLGRAGLVPPVARCVVEGLLAHAAEACAVPAPQPSVVAGRSLHAPQPLPSAAGAIQVRRTLRYLNP